MAAALVVSICANLVRALLDRLPDQVRVVGSSRLSRLEASLALGALIAKALRTELRAIFGLYSSFASLVGRYLHLGATPQGSVILARCDGLQDLAHEYAEHLRKQHGTFIVCRENLESSVRETDEDAVSYRGIVVGSVGVCL